MESRAAGPARSTTTAAKRHSGTRAATTYRGTDLAPRPAACVCVRQQHQQRRESSKDHIVSKRNWDRAHSTPCGKTATGLPPPFRHQQTLSTYPSPHLPSDCHGNFLDSPERVFFCPIPSIVALLLNSMHRAPIRRESNTLLSESREVEARRQPAGSMPGHCDEHVPSHRGSCTRCLPRNRPTRVRSDHTGRVKSIIVCMSLCFAVLPKASDSLAPPPHERVCPGAVEIPGTLPPAPLACAMPACMHVSPALPLR